MDPRWVGIHKSKEKHYGDLVPKPPRRVYNFHLFQCVCKCGQQFESRNKAAKTCPTCRETKCTT